MKALYIALFLMVLSGCAALNNSKGALQPVLLKDAKANIYFTSCSGAVEDWSRCYAKAHSTCAKGYDVLEKNESPVGGRRELTFQCR